MLCQRCTNEFMFGFSYNCKKETTEDLRIRDWSSDVCSSDLTTITRRLEDGTQLSFHEAALVDYAGMWFKRVEGQKFRATLSPSSQGPRVIRDLPFATPWRTIRIARKSVV